MGLLSGVAQCMALHHLQGTQHGGVRSGGPSMEVYAVGDPAWRCTQWGTQHGGVVGYPAWRCTQWGTQHGGVRSGGPSMEVYAVGDPAWRCTQLGTQHGGVRSWGPSMEVYAVGNPAWMHNSGLSMEVVLCIAQDHTFCLEFKHWPFCNKMISSHRVKSVV